MPSRRQCSVTNIFASQFTHRRTHVKIALGKEIYVFTYTQTNDRVWKSDWTVWSVPFACWAAIQLLGRKTCLTAHVWAWKHCTWGPCHAHSPFFSCVTGHCLSQRRKCKGTPCALSKPRGQHSHPKLLSSFLYHATKIVILFLSFPRLKTIDVLLSYPGLAKESMKVFIMS